MGKATEMCLDQRIYQGLFLVIGFLIMLLLLAFVLTIHLVRKLRQYKKTVTAAMNLPSVYYAFPSQASSRSVPCPSAYRQVSHRMQPATSSYSPTMSGRSGFHGSAPSGLDFGTMRSESATETTDASAGTGGLPRTGTYFSPLLITDDHAIPRVRNAH